jgi:hypothetical protein
VVEVLPDIRALSCVWRTTPAGAPAGPVPQRVVLVETGPDGFAPSTAYRVEQALRRAGIRAVVEVLQAGSEVTDYHADALAVARRVSLRSPAGRPHDTAEGDAAGSLFTDSPTPRTVTSTRRRYSAGAHAEKRSTVDASTGRWQPRVAADEPVQPDKDPDPAPSFEAGVRPIHPESPVVEAVAVPVVQVEPEPLPHRPDPAADADLSTKERELLRQLHEELAKREGEPDEPKGNGWQPDRSGQRHSAPPTYPTTTDAESPGLRHAEFDPAEFGGPAWHNGSTDQTTVNGIPPYGGAQA